jgi:hypothetical protein
VKTFCRKIKECLWESTSADQHDQFVAGGAGEQWGAGGSRLPLLQSLFGDMTDRLVRWPPIASLPALGRHGMGRRVKPADDGGVHGDHPAVLPPSTKRTWPVTKSEAGEAR